MEMETKNKKKTGAQIGELQTMRRVFKRLRWTVCYTRFASDAFQFCISYALRGGEQ